MSASIKDSNIDLLEDIDIDIGAPITVQDYSVGFNWANVRRAPESIYARRSFNNVADGTANVEAKYRLSDKSVHLSTSWNNDNLGLRVAVEGNTVDRLSNVDVTKKLDWNANKVSVGAAYNAVKKVITGSATLRAADTVVELEYNTADKAPVVAVTRTLNENEEVSPSVNLKTGDISYGYKRKWAGGSLKGKLFPATQRLEVEWNDEGSRGTWTTSANVPVNDLSGAKVSVKHHWKL